MSTVLDFRSRKERAADTTLDAAEGLKVAIDGIQLLAGELAMTAVAQGLGPEFAEGLRGATALVNQAGHILACVLCKEQPENEKGLELPRAPLQVPSGD